MVNDCLEDKQISCSDDHCIPFKARPIDSGWWLPSRGDGLETRITTNICWKSEEQRSH